MKNNMSIIALDIGDKRVGVAGETQGVIFPISVISRSNLYKELKKIILQREVDTIVVGVPLWIYDSWNKQLPKIQKLIQDLKEVFPDISFFDIDERFSSNLAQRILDEMSIKKEKDAIAATFILESFLLKYKKSLK